MFSVAMAQHDKCFAGFCFARLLHLRLDRSWAIVHPSRRLSQPPAYFAALLVNRIVATAVPAPPQRIPISDHCHISPICVGNCAGNLVCHRSENPLCPLLAPLFWNSKNSQILDKFRRKGPFWTQSDKLWSVWHVLAAAAFSGNSAAFGGNLRRPVPHVFFCRYVFCPS